MNSIICTLFEGHYHHGVAVLINSLYKHGFRGDFFVGYRGELPLWSEDAKDDFKFDWSGARTLNAISDLKIHFLPLTTTSHFANYKPEFILQVWELCSTSSNAAGIFYFDPDIVNKCGWVFYERWINFGVALVHDIVYHDMPSSHPKRLQWAAVASNAGYQVKNHLTSYINSGFIGVSRSQMEFVKLWSQLIDFSVSSFKFDKTKFVQNDENNYDLFSFGDQDLLNLAAMCTNEPISEFGQEGMDFKGGGWLMSHATGSPKPWKKRFISSALKAEPPTLAEKAFWKNADGPISIFNDKIKIKNVSINIASFIGRFYRKR